MGIRDRFKKKEPTEEELREHLTSAGITTKNKSSGAREEKFGAFKNYAQQRANQKPGLAPVNPYANLNQGGGNPYGQESQGGQSNPYGSSQSGNEQSNPYGGNELSNPYGSNNQSNPYGSNNQNNDPYKSNVNGGNSPYESQTNPYSRRPEPTRADRADPYMSRTTTRQSTTSARDDESLDLNAIPSNTMYQSKKPMRKQQAYDEETLDLNALPEEEDDLNVEIDENLPQEQEYNSEDEEIEAIKQDIRFVKQESVASTRNTLRMAQEADASGTNTLGMLGSQSERLYNAEQNLNLADTQTKIAEQKVKQINRLNRSIFIPATGNPFNKKSRLRAQETNLKNEKAQEKYMRESNRRNMYASEQRIKQGITNNNTNSEVYQKYQGEKDLQAAQRYQFENDSEDDEMEKELATNLDQIALYSKKLKSTANTMGAEVDAQNERLRKIEDDADRLDINVHMNSTRLSNIR